MSIKQNGGVFGRNPTFNDVTIEGDLIINGEIFTGLDFQGSWNASTNTPALASSTGTNGEFYIVSVAGTTDLNGITNWGIGDWAIFNGTAWQRVEGGADGNFNDLTANSLTVNSGTTNTVATFTSTDAGAGIQLTDPTGSAKVEASGVNLRVSVDDDAAVANSAIQFRVDGGTKATIDANGNVSILNGNLDVTGELDVTNTAARAAYIRSTTTGSRMHFLDATTTSVTTVGVGAEGNNLVLHGGGAEVLRGSSSGDVSIPNGDLDVNGTATMDGLTVDGGNSGSNVDVASFTSATGALNINCSDLSAANPTWTLRSFSGEPIAFAQGTTEAMRIDASQNVLIAGITADPQLTTNPGVVISEDAYVGIGRANNVCLFLNRQGSDGEAAVFRRDGGTKGSISVTGSATAYNTSSDYRLKEDWQPMSGATDRLKELKPVNFAWKSDGSRVDGFIAHEAQEVVPESVTGSKDAMQDEEYEVTPAVYEDVITPAVEAVEGVEAVEAVEAVAAVYDDEGLLVSEAIEAVEAVEGVDAVEAQAETTESVLVSEAVMATRSVPDYQGIDQSKLVPLLTAALQEAITKIESLTTRIETLEGQ